MDHKPENSVATKFLIRFVGVQFIALVVAVILVISGYSKVAHEYVRSQALQFMDVMVAVREYTSRKVNPILAPSKQPLMRLFCRLPFRAILQPRCLNI